MKNKTSQNIVTKRELNIQKIKKIKEFGKKEKFLSHKNSLFNLEN